jgi:hypothetical protein
VTRQLKARPSSRGSPARADPTRRHRRSSDPFACRATALLAKHGQRASDGRRDRMSLANLMKSITSDRIVGLCITHQRESYAPVDENNHCLRNAILWDEGRAQKQLDELGQRFGDEEPHRRTGRGPSLTQAFPQLLWFVQNEPQVTQRAYKFIDVQGYLVQGSAPFSHSTIRWPGTSRRPYYLQVD